MSCPNCKELCETHKLAKHLSGKICGSCEGVVFNLSDYFYYLSRSEFTDKEIESAGLVVELEADTKQAVVCDCGKIMNKYRINNQTNHRIDCCSACHSIYLDKGEWEYLQAKHLQRCINKIFTAPYQRDLRNQNTAAVLTENFQHQLGDIEYKKIKEIREWINASPNKDKLITYINTKNPYSVNN